MNKLVLFLLWQVLLFFAYLPVFKTAENCKLTLAYTCDQIPLNDLPSSGCSDEILSSDIRTTVDNSSYDFNFNCLRLNLHNEIMARLNSHLNINLNNVIRHYEINNWPDFVSFNLNEWNEEDMNEIRFVLPTITFTELSSSKANTNRTKFVGIEISKINALLLAKLKSQNVGVLESCTKLHWCKYHLKGWPEGVSDHSNSLKFKRPEMLAIRRGIDTIRFIPISKGEERTITYTNGNVVPAILKPRLENR